MEQGTTGEECGWPLEDKKAKKHVSPEACKRELSAADTFILASEANFWQSSDLPHCKVISVCHLQLNVWCFVTAAIGN